MSFDLYFCGPPGTQLDLSRVQQYMTSQEYTTESRSDDGSLIQFEYTEPETGVYCLFDVLTTAKIEQQESLALPDSHVNTGLSVSINFLRPHFFALELMPIISRLAGSLGLSLYDPQEDRIYPPGTPSEILIQTWIEHNRRATQAMAQTGQPIRKPYLAREQALYWWQYTSARRALQNRFGEDVFVPSILLMTHDHYQVKPVVVWSATVQRRLLRARRIPLPQLFPKCEYLILAWGKTANELNKGIVPYSSALSAMVGLLEDIDGPVDGLKVLWPARQEPASAIFEGLPVADLDELKRIPPDGFVDVTPPSE
jgi:hypothetical protein